MDERDAIWGKGMLLGLLVLLAILPLALIMPMVVTERPREPGQPLVPLILLDPGPVRHTFCPPPRSEKGEVGGVGDLDFIITCIFPTPTPTPPPPPVVFLVDASGSMLDLMPGAITQLLQIVYGLPSNQKFTILFYQDGRAIEVLEPGLKVADRTSKDQVMAWLHGPGNVVPGGRADIRPALAKALQYEPRLVYVITDDILSNGSHGGLTSAQVLEMFREASGAGDVVFHTMQLSDRDPLMRAGDEPLLKQISTESGGAYRHIIDIYRP